MITKGRWGVIASALLLGGCGETGVFGPDPAQEPSVSGIRTMGHEDLVVAAAGLQFQPNVFSVTLPVASPADILEARFVWTGRATDPAGDDTIVINGIEHTGTLISSFQVPESPPWILIYELDAIGIAQPGSNTFQVSGFMLPGRAAGIAFVSVIAAPTSPWTSVTLVSPNEFVHGDSPGHGKGQVQVFPFTALPTLRTARFVVIAADGRSSRPDRTWWSSGAGSVPPDLSGVGQLLANRYNSALGARMDILQEPTLAIPAGANYFAYQLESAPGGDSLIHLVGALCATGDEIPCTADITGRVWQDYDRDGVLEPGEPGLSSVRLELADAAGGFLAETLTASGGEFEFADRCAGAYVVTVDPSTLPLGFAPTTCAGVGSCSPATVVLASDEESSPPLAFGWAGPVPSHCFFGVDFWSAQVDAALAGVAGVPISGPQLQDYLAIAAANTQVDYDHGDGTISLREAQRCLDSGLRVGSRARANHLAALLNFALNGADESLLVDTDGDTTPDMTFGDALQQIDAILVSPARDPSVNQAAWRRALRMAASINAMHDDRCTVPIG